MSKFIVPEASAKILAREAELIAEVNKYNSEAFQAERHRRLENARNGDADPKHIKALTELAALGNEWNEKREAHYIALQGLRNASFITIRDEIVKPLLQARLERKEQLDKDIQALRAKYHGCQISYDHNWDTGSISTLKDISTRTRPVSDHMVMADFLDGYSL